MRYLYGDSSPFPLNENFLDTLGAATACAAALLTIDEAIGRARRTEEQTDNVAMRELADIEKLMQQVDQALAQREHLSEATAKVAAQVSSGAKAQFERACAGIKAWRESTVRNSYRGCGPADVMAPIHRFLISYQLPYTAWGLRWKAGHGDEPVQAQVHAMMQRGLTATLGVTIPAKHLWAQPVRVGQLEKGLTIQLVGKNWLGREGLRDESLERLYVTRITRTPDKHAFVVSRKPKEPSEGLRITLRDGDVKRITVQRVDPEEAPLGDPATLDGEDASKIQTLWRHIEQSIADLVHHRTQLLAASLQGQRVSELESPSVVAMAIIESVAPLARDIVRHSRTPGELQLKRDLGDGRREELFIPATDITGKYDSLEPRNQQLFDAYGIGPGGLAAAEAASQRASDPGPAEPTASPEHDMAAEQAAPADSHEAMLPPPPSVPEEVSVSPSSAPPAREVAPEGRPSTIPPPSMPRRRTQRTSTTPTGPAASTPPASSSPSGQLSRSGEFALPAPSVPPRRSNPRLASG